MRLCWQLQVYLHFRSYFSYLTEQDLCWHTSSLKPLGCFIYAEKAVDLIPHIDIALLIFVWAKTNWKEKNHLLFTANADFIFTVNTDFNTMEKKTFRHWYSFHRLEWPSQTIHPSIRPSTLFHLSVQCCDIGRHKCIYDMIGSLLHCELTCLNSNQHHQLTSALWLCTLISVISVG